MQTWRRIGACTALILGMMVPGAARAHDRGTSYSTWDLRGRAAHVTVRFLEIEATRFPWWVEAGTDRERLLGQYVMRHLHLLAGDRPCPLSEGPRFLATEPGRVAVEWSVTCPEGGALQLRSRLWLDEAPSHLHLVRLTRDGGAPLERVLSAGQRVWDLPDNRAPADTRPQGTSLPGYVALGIDHILTGYDHLAFVLALILLGSSAAEVARVVTGFTVAHSLTLALASLGYVRPDRAPIEALIGLSIALVAAENLWLRSARSRAVPLLIAVWLGGAGVAAAAGHGSVPALTFAGLMLFCLCYFGLLWRVAHTGSLRWSVAFVFGLVHGFGFAGVLGEAGLPVERVVAALFGFNAGVEFGQLGVVVLIWPALRIVARRRAPVYHAMVDYGSAVIVAVGIFWFVTRTYG